MWDIKDFSRLILSVLQKICEVGSGTQARIPAFKISYSAEPQQEEKLYEIRGFNDPPNIPPFSHTFGEVKNSVRLRAELEAERSLLLKGC